MTTRNSKLDSFPSLSLRISAGLRPISDARRKPPGSPSFPSFTSHGPFDQVDSLSAAAAALLALERYFASNRLFSRIQRVIAIANAASVPGFTGTQLPGARDASFEKRGSTTVILSVPSTRRWVMRGLRFGGP